MVNKAKKIVSLALVSLIFAPLLALGEAVGGVEGGVEGGKKPFMPQANDKAAEGLDAYKFSDQSLVEVVETIGSYVIGILVIVAVFYVLLGAYSFITAAGQSEKIAEGRNRIMYAGIGIIVALLARGIIALVLQVAQ